MLGSCCTINAQILPLSEKIDWHLVMSSSHFSGVGLSLSSERWGCWPVFASFRVRTTEVGANCSPQASWSFYHVASGDAAGVAVLNGVVDSYLHGTLLASYRMLGFSVLTLGDDGAREETCVQGRNLVNFVFQTGSNILQLRLLSCGRKRGVLQDADLMTNNRAFPK